MTLKGNEAERYIDTGHVLLCKKIARDKSNKAVCYKLTKGSGREFAFDPNQSSQLSIQFDIEPPSIAGVYNIQCLKGKPLSTVWARVFSGGVYFAYWRANVESKSSLDNVLDYLSTK